MADEAGVSTEKGNNAVPTPRKDEADDQRSGRPQPETDRKRTDNHESGYGGKAGAPKSGGSVP